MRLISILYTLLFIGLPAATGAVLDLPLDMRWGEAPGKLVDWAGDQGLEVSITIPANESENRIIRVQTKGPGGIPGLQGNSLEARYVRGRLVEITETLDNPAGGAAKLKADFLIRKKALIARYGALKLNRRASTTKNDFTTDSVSYHAEPVPGLFLLIAHTEVEDRLRQVRQGKFSVIYRNENLSKRLAPSS